jgi:hypothetical protein
VKQIVDSVGNLVNVSAMDGYLVMEPVDRETVAEWLPDKARELAAILLHFADTGELPNDGEGGRDDN